MQSWLVRRVLTTLTVGLAVGCTQEALPNPTPTPTPDPAAPSMASPPTTQSTRCGATAQALGTAAGSPNGLRLGNDAVAWSTVTVDTHVSTVWRTAKGTQGATQLLDDARLLDVDGNQLLTARGPRLDLFTTDLHTAIDEDLKIALADYSGSYSTLSPLLAQGEVWWMDGMKGGGAFEALALPTGTPVARHLADRWVVADAWAPAGTAWLWLESGTLWRGDSNGATALAKGIASIIRADATVAYVQQQDTVVAVTLADGSQKKVADLTFPQNDPGTCSGQIGKYGVHSVFAAPDGTIYFSVSRDCLDDKLSHHSQTFWRADATPTKVVEFSTFEQFTDFATDGECVYYVTLQNASTTPVSTLHSIAASASMK
jgi:hypothetical protein